MSTLKVGDTVRVKIDPIEASNTPNVVPSMRKYYGTFVTISETTINASGIQRYYIYEDRQRFIWCDEFFEMPDFSKDPYEYW